MEMRLGQTLQSTRCSVSPGPVKILVTGSSGLVGAALVPALVIGGQGVHCRVLAFGAMKPGLHGAQRSVPLVSFAVPGTHKAHSSSR